MTERLKPGSHLCDKHNTSDISISISTRKKEHVPFFLCLCLCLCRLCYAYRTCEHAYVACVMLIAQVGTRLNGSSKTRPSRCVKMLKL